MQIEPEKQLPPPICPFCKKGLEFLMNESFENTELRFRCLSCRKIIIVLKYEEN